MKLLMIIITKRKENLLLYKYKNLPPPTPKKRQHNLPMLPFFNLEKPMLLRYNLAMKNDFQKGEIVIYTTEDGSVSLDTKLENETIWLTQDMMTKLFETTKQNISLHINNIYT